MDPNSKQGRRALFHQSWRSGILRTHQYIPKSSCRQTCALNLWVPDGAGCLKTGHLKWTNLHRLTVLPFTTMEVTMSKCAKQWSENKNKHIQTTSLEYTPSSCHPPSIWMILATAALQLMQSTSHQSLAVILSNGWSSPGSSPSVWIVNKNRNSSLCTFPTKPHQGNKAGISAVRLSACSTSVAVGWT